MRNLIKSFAVIAAALLTFSACQREKTPVEPEQQLYYITFVAEEPATKTTVEQGTDDEGNKVANYSWTASDANSERWTVYRGNDVATSVTATLSEGLMTISAGFASPSTTGDSFVALFNKGVGAVQNITAESVYDSASDVMVSAPVPYEDGVAEYGFRFKRLGAIGKATVKGLTGMTALVDAKLIATDGTVIAADYDVEKKAFAATGSKSITVKGIDCDPDANNNFSFYFITVPSKSVNLKLLAKVWDDQAEEKLYVKQFTRPITGFSEGDVFAFNVSGFTEVTTKANFNINGEVTSKPVYEGEPVEFINAPATIAGYDFVGWTSTALDEPQDDAPEFVNTSAQVMGNESVTYYAVYAVASEDGLEDTPFLSLNFLDAGWNFPKGSSNKKVAETSYTNNGSTISVAGSTGEGFYLMQSTAATPTPWALLLGKNGAYVKLPQKDGVKQLTFYPAVGGTPSASVTWNVFAGTEVASSLPVPTGKTNNDVTGLKDNAVNVPILPEYQNSQLTLKVTSAANIQVSKVEYYKAKLSYSDYCTSIDTRTVTSLAWSAPTATGKIGGENEFPTLTTTPAELSGVTYSSSNPEYATIDPSTGSINLVAVGTTTITASFAGDETYQPAASVSYTLNVTAPAKHTVTFSINGDTSSEEVDENDPIDFPEVSEITGVVFKGWTKNAIVGTQAQAPQMVNTEEEAMGNADVTYYAVFATATKASTFTDTKLSSNSFSTTGTYVLVANESSSSTTLHYFSSYSSTTANISWGVTSTTATDAITFTLSGTADALVAKDASGNYIQAIASGNFRMNSTSQTLTLKSDGTIYNPTSTSYNLRYNDNSGRGGFRWYSGTTGTSAYFYERVFDTNYSDYCTTVVVLSRIEVSGTPTKTTYEDGEALQTAGLTVTAFYSDNSTAPVTEGIAWSVTPETLTYGTTSCNVTATALGKTSATYTVNGLTVNAPIVLTGIEVSGTPTKTSYRDGEAFETAGLVVKAVYSNGNKETVTEGIVWSVSPETLTYVEGTETYSVEVTATALEKTSAVYEVNGLTVSAPVTLTSISVKTAPTKVIYTEEENFNPAGLVIYKNYSDGSKDELAYAGNESSFSFNPALDAALQTSNTAVTITCGDYSVDQAITVNQIPTFASLEDLVAANLTSGTKVRVTFENVPIKSIYVYNQKRQGVYFDIQKGGHDIEIYYTSEEVPQSWAVEGTLSGTMICPWTYYERGTTWELAPVANSWSWSNLTYKAPLEPCATPEISITDAGSATISCGTAGATIYYTLGNSPVDPTSASTRYTGAVTMTDGQTIKAIAYKDGMKASEVTSKKYTTAQKLTYSFTIQTSDFNTTSYAANNGSHDFTAKCTTDNSKTLTVAVTTNAIFQNSSKMQWQKTNGYLFNTTDLGTIKSVTVNGSDGTFTTYYGTTQNPTSGTTVGNGYFTVKNTKNGASYCTSIVVTFEK